MDTINKIFKKLAEAEKRQKLSKHKVELNIINNAKNALQVIEKAKKDSFKALDKIDKNGKKYAEQINKLISKFEEEVNEINSDLLTKSQIEDGKAALKRIQETAKDLGLKSKEIPVYNKLEKELDGAEDLISDLKIFEQSQYDKFKRLIKF